MGYDQDKLDEVALALLSLTLFDDQGVPRAWKGLDWGLMGHLHQKGWIADPRGKAKSVILLDEGVTKAEEFFEKHFGGQP